MIDPSASSSSAKEKPSGRSALLGVGLTSAVWRVAAEV